MNEKDVVSKTLASVLKSQGLSNNQIAAFLATAEANSGMKSAAVEGVASEKEFNKNYKEYDEYMKNLKKKYGSVTVASNGQSYPGIGLGNWRGEDARRLIEYAGKYDGGKASWTDPSIQSYFLIEKNKEIIETMKQYPNMSIEDALKLIEDPKNSLKKTTKEKKLAMATKYLNTPDAFIPVPPEETKRIINETKKFKDTVKKVGDKIDPFAKAKNSVKNGKTKKKDGKEAKKVAEKKKPLTAKQIKEMEKKAKLAAKKKAAKEKEDNARMVAAKILENTYDGEDTTKGLRVKDICGVLGIPPQFLPTADPRLSFSEGKAYGGNSGIGRVYATNIVKYMPLLLVIPGVPEFMKGFSNKQKKTILSGFIRSGSQEFEDLLNTGGGKYYSLKPELVGYYEHVNTALRATAIMLNIHKYTYHGTTLDRLDWKNVTGGGSLMRVGGLFNQYNQAIPLYADCGTDVSETFSNSTSQSSLSGMVNGLSDKARELSFFMGLGSNALGLKLDRFMGQEALASSIETSKKMVDGILGGRGNLLSSLLTKAETVMAGGRIIFPEIWSDSSFGRSYSCKMNLVAIGGDDYSLYLGIMTPLWHVLCLVLPRNADSQAYYSPFLVRAYYKGMFNIDMGIITDLSVTKGGEGEWNINGIPTQAELSFTIKDLYEELSITGDQGVGTKLVSNVAELDYIANTCGININDTDIGRTMKLIVGLGYGKITNIFTKAFQKVNQSVNTRISNILSHFY